MVHTRGSRRRRTDRGRADGMVQWAFTNANAPMRRYAVIRAGIVGGTGYTGVELLRLLAMHGDVEVALITSRAEAGMRVD